MSDLFLSYPTIHRIPNPEGRGIKISAEASGLGVDAITETFNAGSLGSSVATRGVWANVDLTSIATSGYLANLSLVDQVENTVIFTEFGPLTRGYGDAALARVQDVTVVVNGSEVTPVAIDAVAGIIILGDVLDSSDEVLLDYYYTPNPTLAFAGLNNSNYLLNQVEGSDVHPFRFKTVLGVDASLAQPEIVEHRWTALDYEYTSGLNDATSLVLNEPTHRQSLSPFQRDLRPSSVFFEGDDHPEGFTFTGPTLGTPVFTSDNLYVIEDASTGVDNSQGLASLFRQKIDLTYFYQSLLSWRMRVDTYTLDGVFTGLCAGYADDDKAYLAGYLELSGNFKTIGVLTDEGDETLVESWQGVLGTVEDDSGSFTKLRTASEPPFIVGQRIWSEGAIYTVLDIDDEGVDGYLSTFSSAFPALGEVEYFVETDWTQLSSYRASVLTDEPFQVFVAGSPAPVASAEKDALAVAPEIFALLKNNTLFFGSCSRRGESLSAWDFVRYAITPTQGSESASTVSVDTEMEVLPEAASPPWYVVQNQGYARTLPGNLVLQQSAGQPLTGLGYSWGRIEPFLTSNVLRELRFKVRVSSWASGMAQTLTIADDKRQATLSLFDTRAADQFASSAALARLGSGIWPAVNPVSLSTRGFLDGYNVPGVDAFLYAYGGVTSPSDAGFTSTLDETELAYEDHQLLLTHDGVAASAFVSESGEGSYTNWISSARVELRDWTLDANNVVPFYFGVDDGDRVYYLAPYEDGTRQLILVDSTGAPVLDGGSPVGVTYDWAVEGFQALKMARYEDNLTVFVDGVYVGVIDALLAPSSGVSDVTSRFGVLSGQVTLSLDYYFAHQAGHENRRIGLYTGSGSVLDASQYTSAPGEFFGTFLDVRVRIDPTTTVEVFLNGSTTSVISVPYDDLPLREERDNIETDFGFVQFGTLDPAAYTESHWDWVRYDLVNQREDQRTLRGSVIHRVNTLTSPEPVIDEGPEIVTLLPYTLDQVRLGRVGMFADRVLSVTSADGLTALGYSFDRETNTITLDSPLASLETEVVVTFFSSTSYTMSYLKNNEAAIQLGETTPPFALTHQAEVTAEVEFNSQLNDLNDRLNNDSDFVFNDTGQTVVFRRNRDAFLSCLDLCSETSQGVSGLVSSVCDSGGWTALGFEDPYEDEYVFPDQNDENPLHRGKILQLNNVDTPLNQQISRLICPPSSVTLVCEIVEEDTYDGASDEVLTGSPDSVLTDFNGSTVLNNLKTTLNVAVTTPGDVHPDSTPATANNLTSTDIPLDFVTTVYYP